jgi:hypothetical protein
MDVRLCQGRHHRREGTCELRVLTELRRECVLWICKFRTEDMTLPVSVTIISFIKQIQRCGLQ